MSSVHGVSSDYSVSRGVACAAGVLVVVPDVTGVAFVHSIQTIVWYAQHIIVQYSTTRSMCHGSRPDQDSTGVVLHDL